MIELIIPRVLFWWFVSANEIGRGFGELPCFKQMVDD